MKICPKCGKENSSDNKFCNYCGEAMGSSKKEGKGKIMPAVIIGALLVVLLIAGGAYFLMGKGANNKRTSDDPMLLSDSWKDIIKAGKNGSYKKKYRVGDTKELNLGTEGIITMRLVAMDADELADGSGFASMTWIAEDLLNTEHVMNTEPTIDGGWPASDLRAWLSTSVYELVPEEVRTAIKEVNKYSYIYTKTSAETVSSADTIWIPSCREIYGENSADEDRGVDYSNAFPDENSWKRCHVNYTEEIFWFLRSSRALKNGQEGFIDGSTGSPYDSPTGYYELMPANEEHGIVIGFCL